jgi:hypothetical protein
MKIKSGARYQDHLPSCLVEVERQVLIIVQKAIVKIMDDEPRRAYLGKLGRARVEQELAWSHQERAYLGAYQRLTAGARALQRTGS